MVNCLRMDYTLCTLCGEMKLLTEERMDQRHIIVHIEAMLARPVIDSGEVVTAVLSMEICQRPAVVIDPIISPERDVSFAH